ncbi:DUF2750 domain-containing protein [Endozoicomonas arenosclerae]|uniref:DUF2750 domain-containing protein n=1 Tax=Endozoicomonas arenosclerae TaxID=1633495 RepID=UPI000784E3B4|nr:DUF2750 domain-containing protein [Endozoicomonas arenosclerae]
MSQSSLHADAFYKDVAQTKIIWGIRDKNGIPAPMTKTGLRAMPFWSAKSRVEKIINTVPDYKKFEPFEIPWADFKERWIPGMSNDNYLVGLNWSGSKATGYDSEPEAVLEAIEYQINQIAKSA